MNLTKFWRNTTMMLLCFLFTYWLVLFWLIPSVNSAVAGFKAPVICATFALGCLFGDRAQRYRTPERFEV
ncbi:MAG: hypothetical protein U0Z75_00095 [Deinococcaceae bacterium]